MADWYVLMVRLRRPAKQTRQGCLARESWNYKRPVRLTIISYRQASPHLDAHLTRLPI